MKTTKRLVTASLLAALCCVATMIIKLPSPLGGYINLGDCIVLLSGAVLSPSLAFLSSALGSMLADVLSGFALYAPATFLIKGIMALFFSKFGKGKGGKTIAVAAATEAIMILGYLLFESFIYGFVPSLSNVPANAVQGALGVVLGLILINVFKKTKILK